ncbi:hypothetical protein TREES_T100003318 [Tupaia chinensis]|uniref:Uncharacterized protein n=1 Tax=Tupaia chinensis TaxID=246437 RepID=L9JGW0_TUPCH|nr:hypothetical protein TREES_T100003318 [Tupaia chinensis]
MPRPRFSPPNAELDNSAAASTRGPGVLAQPLRECALSPLPEGHVAKDTRTVTPQCPAELVLLQTRRSPRAHSQPLTESPESKGPITPQYTNTQTKSTMSDFSDVASNGKRSSEVPEIQASITKTISSIYRGDGCAAVAGSRLPFQPSLLLL